LVATCHFFHPFSVFHTETALWPSKNRNWDFTAPLTKLTESQYCTMSLRQATFFAGWPVGRPGPRPPVRFLTSPWIEATAYDVFSAGRCFTGADAATSSLRVEDMLDRGCGQRACFESLIFTDSSGQVRLLPTCSCSARVVYVAAAPDSECSACVSSDPKFTPAFPCKTTPRVLEFRG
jgi:hypothetical protein